MKRRTQLFLLSFFGMFWVANSCLAGTPDNKNEDMAAELSEKTFAITELARGNAAQEDYDAYFKKGGILAIKFSPRHSKSGKWEVDDKSVLCITTLRHKKNKSINQTQCGKVVKSNASSYRWYDDKGELRANFSLKGEGDRLP